ncbi:TPA: archemetzincin [Candidatus Bathyarchaeota archaeon]|nr:archemetzincin [Candidatus Bathyarchaeota archaeon]
MKIHLLAFGKIDSSLLKFLESTLPKIFPRSSCKIFKESFSIPSNAFNPMRRQYNSTIILKKVHDYAVTNSIDKALGILDVDIYVPGMNFIFGQAQCPGKAAVVSLYRLNPIFYGLPLNRKLFWNRTLKEAVHELGHTLGLGHCSDSQCVMFFSLHIGMTDMKGFKFCEKCRRKVENRILA